MRDQDFASSLGVFRSKSPKSGPIPSPGVRPMERDTWQNLAGKADGLYEDVSTAAMRAEQDRCAVKKGPRVHSQS